MKLGDLLPVISQLTGRDLKKDVDELIRVLNALEAGLDAQGRAFVTANHKELAAFLETEKGQQAARDFVASWSGIGAPAIEKPEPEKPQQTHQHGHGRRNNR